MSDKRKSSGRGRTRNYATIVYPDSCPDNWLDILREMKINILISPLHDKDVNPDNEPKKPHYHVLFIFDSVKSVSQVQELVDLIQGVGVEPVNSVRSYARYLCHLDNPDKHPYPTDDVTVIGSEDYLSLISIPTDKYRVIQEIITWCCETECFYYSDLIRYSMENRDDWFRTLCDNGTYVVKEFLKSENFKRKMISEGEQQ